MFESAWFLLTVLTSLTLVGATIPVARSLGVVDKPGVIKIHALPTPRLGGIGIVASVVVWGYFTQTLLDWSLLGLLIIALIGVLDDCYNLSPRIRLAAELLAGVALGLHFWESLGWVALLLGLILVPVMSNAVNLTDGMNGLASGNALISALGLAVLLWGASSEVPLTLVLAGSLLGFLAWNYPQAKTFMGDGGSLSIGYLLAMCWLVAATQGITTFLAAGVMLWFPLYDMLAGIVRRWRSGKPIFDGDRDHTYDRLDQLYLRNPARTVLVVWMTSLILVLAGLLVNSVSFWLGIGLSLLVVILLFWVAYRLGSL